MSLQLLTYSGDLQQPQYAAVSHLTLCCPPFDEHNMENLMNTTWTKLRSLTLSSIKLDIKTTCCLGNESWPNLRQLDLSDCGLDTNAMAVLVQGQWPELENLNSLANPLLDGAAISVLALASWPRLRLLQLRCTELKPGSFTWLLHQEWITSHILICVGPDWRTSCV